MAQEVPAQIPEVLDPRLALEPPQVVDAIPSVLDGLVVHLFAVVSQRRGKESRQGIIVILWFH